MKKDSILYTVGFTFVVCAFFVFFLALANELTKDKAAANNRVAERKAILAALGAPAWLPADTDSAYERDVTVLEVASGAFTSDSSGAPARLYMLGSGEAARYAARIAGSGLWGGISAILAVDARVERIVGLEIVSQNETPGLGGRIGESWFTRQFRGEAVKALSIRVREGGGKGDPDPDNGEVDAVTGASLTSSSIERIVNRGLAAFGALRDQGSLK